MDDQKNDFLMQKSGHHQEIQNQPILIINPQSEYFELYNSIMSHILLDDPQCIKEKLMSNGIKILPDFVYEPSVKLLQLNLDSALVEVSVGYFQTHLTICRVLLFESEIIQRNYIGAGSYANIHTIKLFEEQYACKSIKVVNSNEFSNLLHIYKEYIIAKIASILEIGPHLQPAFGYDIVCVRDCALFTMEICSTNFSLPLSKQSQKQLLMGIKLLHHLKICHGDIKLQNLAFSRKYQKFIFVDFGLSKVIKAQIGYKSLTQFFGTFKNASPDMKKAYFLQSSNYVDLYYNDVYSLNLLLLRSTNQVDLFKLQQADELLPSSTALILSIKHLLFRGSIDKAYDLILKSETISNALLKIFIEEIFILRSKHFCELNSVLGLLKKQAERRNGETSEIDKNLCAYFQAFYNKQFDKYFVSIITYVEGEMPLDFIWEGKNEIWIDEIVIFLEASQTESLAEHKSNFLLRKKLIEKMFNLTGLQCYLKEEENLAFLFKFRTVLSLLLEHYQKKRSARFIEAIRILQLKIDDLPGQYRSEGILIGIYTENGQSRDEIALRKLQYYLQRKLMFCECQQYPGKELLQINKFYHHIQQPTCLENLLQKVVEFNDYLAKQKANQILQLFNQALKQFDVFKDYIEDLIVFFKCINDWNFFIANYSTPKSPTIKLALQKFICYSCVGTNKVFDFFKNDTYLSHTRGYLQIIKNMYQFNERQIWQVCDQYFEFYYKNLPYPPLSNQIISIIFKQPSAPNSFVYFINKFISSFISPTPAHSWTHSFENLKLISEILIFFIAMPQLFTSQYKATLLSIFSLCKKQINELDLNSTQKIVLQFSEILWQYFSQGSLAFVKKLLTLSNKITTNQIFTNSTCKSVVEMIAVHSSIATIQKQIGDYVIYMSEECRKHEKYNLFSEFRYNLLHLQNILETRNLCEEEFRFLLAITDDEKKMKGGNLRVISLKINEPYHQFVSAYSVKQLLKIVAIICKQDPISTVKNLYYLSGLYMQIYLKVESELPLETRTKLLVIIAFGLPRLIWVSRKVVLLPVYYKKHTKLCHYKSRRKQMICLKTRAKYEQNMRRWANKIDYQMVNNRGRVMEKLKRKIQKLL